MYVIHLIILLNILGVMIDNKRFVLYCIMTITCCFTITKRKDDNSADFNDFTVISHYKPNAEHLEKNNG